MQQRPELSARDGFGLSSMRQRAGAIGGEWQIESEPGAGTRVSVRLLKRACLSVRGHEDQDPRGAGR